MDKGGGCFPSEKSFTQIKQDTPTRVQGGCPRDVFRKGNDALEAAMVGRRFWKAFWLSALLCFVSLDVFAQSSSTLSGTVHDPSGAAVPGASVKVINQDSHDQRATKSTGEGVFSVPALHAGTYTVTASA